MKIKLKDTEYALKNSFRALMCYEQAAGKTFTPSNLTDLVFYFYCVLITSNKDTVFNFEDFMDELDENPNLIVEFTNWITEAKQQEEKIYPQQEETKKKRRTAGRSN